VLARPSRREARGGDEPRVGRIRREARHRRASAECSSTEASSYFSQLGVEQHGGQISRERRIGLWGVGGGALGGHAHSWRICSAGGEGPGEARIGPRGGRSRFSTGGLHHRGAGHSHRRACRSSFGTAALSQMDTFDRKAGAWTGGKIQGLFRPLARRARRQGVIHPARPGKRFEKVDFGLPPARRVRAGGGQAKVFPRTWRAGVDGPCLSWMARV